MKSIIITVLINVVLTEHHNKSHHYHLVNILKSKANFYGKMNENFQNIMNELFKAMNLTNQFVDKPKVKLLLTMLYDLNNISSNNSLVYDVLKNITTVEANSKAINRIRLDEMVREIVNENLLNVDNKTKDKNSLKSIVQASIRAAATQTTRRMQPMSEFKDSKEFKQFIGNFLLKIRSLTVEDLFKKKPQDTSRWAQRELKLWEPPTDLKQWSNNDTGYRRIFKGKKTNILTFPFVVSIHVLHDFMCAGSIIMKDLVITAASCMQIHYNNRFFRENPRTTSVRIGSDWTGRRGEMVQVLEVYFYPAYDPKTLRHNIALLRLARTIKFQTRRRSKVRRIQLDNFDGNLPTNTHKVVVLGWGATKAHQIVNSFEKLQVSFLDIYPLEDCKKIYSKSYVTENNFCAGYITRGSGACNRDVGGPGVVGGHLVGIISFGSPVCGTINAPTVFTRVGNYIDWIETIMQKNPPRYGVPTTTRMTSRAFIYNYNTITARTYPILTPLKKITHPDPRSHSSANAHSETYITEVTKNDDHHQNNQNNDTKQPNIEDTKNQNMLEVDSKLNNNLLLVRSGLRHQATTATYNIEFIKTLNYLKTEINLSYLQTQTPSLQVKRAHYGYDNSYQSGTREAEKFKLDDLKDIDVSREEYFETQATVDSKGSIESPDAFTDATSIYL